MALLVPMLDRLPKNVQEMKRYTLGTYRGLKFGIVIYPNFSRKA